MADAGLTVLECWGAVSPDWVCELANEVDARGSQEAVGKLIGYSAAVVNQVLHNAYGVAGKGGNLGKVEQAVRGALMGATVVCPAIGGALRRDLCLKEQATPLHSGDPARAKFWRACRSGCPHSRLKREFFPPARDSEAAP